ncbi:hypothetical protein SMSK321_1443 [Streptococcus mitis SK321]|nr:hypothetical protein SMSK321_1443 [Streptococcus mitis SK321]
MKIQEQANYSNHSFEIADKATLFEVYFHLNPCYNSPILVQELISYFSF